MKVRYCPNCGAQCGAEDRKCGECDFPIEIRMIKRGKQVFTESGQSEIWGKIAQLLRNNGINIQVKRENTWASHRAWWALPIVGLVLFLGTLFFGGSIADSLVPPPTAQAYQDQVLDMGNMRADGAPPPEQQGPADPGSPEDELDTSFLKEALKTTEAQEQVTESLNLDMSRFVDRPNASPRALQETGERALLHLNVKKRRGFGCLLNSRGDFLVDNESLFGAFQRETQTVANDRKFFQKTKFVVPEVRRDNGSKVDSVLVMASETIGISLLQASIDDTGPDFTVNYDMDLGLGDTVFVVLHSGSEVYAEASTIADIWTNGSDISFWVLENTLGSGVDGAPILNQQGEVAGLLLNRQNRSMVLSMNRLRERAPQLFKEIIN